MLAWALQKLETFYALFKVCVFNQDSPRVRLHVTKTKSHPAMKLVAGWVSSRDETSTISSQDEILFERKPLIQYENI